MSLTTSRLMSEPEAMDDSEIYSRLGRLVRQHRERLSISQDVLAAAIGLSRASVANIEAGRQHIPLHHLFRLARALKVDPETLLPRGEDIAPPSRTPRVTATQDLTERERANVARIYGAS
jgi:transcriptional regulator with XRE-family HTH domain